MLDWKRILSSTVSFISYIQYSIVNNYDAVQLNFETVTTYEKAKSYGLEEGSLEFGLIVTDFIIQAERERKNIEATYDMTMVSIAATIIISNGSVRPKNNKQFH